MREVPRGVGPCSGTCCLGTGAGGTAWRGLGQGLQRSRASSAPARALQPLAGIPPSCPAPDPAGTQGGRETLCPAQDLQQDQRFPAPWLAPAVLASLLSPAPAPASRGGSAAGMDKAARGLPAAISAVLSPGSQFPARGACCDNGERVPGLQGALGEHASAQPDHKRLQRQISRPGRRVGGFRWMGLVRPCARCTAGTLECPLCNPGSTHACEKRERKKKNKKAFAFTVGVLHTQIAARGLLQVPLMKEAQRRVL